MSSQRNFKTAKLCQQKNWRDMGDYVLVTYESDGTLGPDWTTRTCKNGNRLNNQSEFILNSKDFIISPIGKPIQIAVLKGGFFSDSDRFTKKIYLEGEHRGWKKSFPDSICYLREKFNNEELDAMGFSSIVAMHEPIKDSWGIPNLLRIGQENNKSCLLAYHSDPMYGFGCNTGFAFFVSQVNS